MLLARMDGNDHVNDLFEYRVEAICPQPNLDFDQLLGTHATISLKSLSHGDSHFDGIVTQARWLGMGDTGNLYEFWMRPWFWLAGKRRNQRIFHEMTVEEILDTLLAEYSHMGDKTYENKLTGTYPKLEYTVQYRESDLEFACRLMERFGISYHFRHEMGLHTLVLTDAHDGFAELPGGKRVYVPTDPHHGKNQHRSEDEHFWNWAPARAMSTGAVRLTDYNFKSPTTAMETDQIGDAHFAHGQIESYDYPGIYPDKAAGKSVVSLRTVQERSTDYRHEAQGDVISLKSGMRLTLTGANAPQGLLGDYLCLSVAHIYRHENYGSGDGVQAGIAPTEDTEQKHAFTASYILTPVSAPFAPLRKTRQPLVHGPQTARVVGDGEIDCDEYGRILVRFHWDREDAYSMRCRVSQNWAGKGWGGMIIPRIGMEVIVEFLEGDPDQPIVTGCVFNGKNDAPYPLPAHKTKAVLRSDSHQSTGYNEISFEDAAGKENIFVHAQKDHTVKVLNDMSANVQANRLDNVGNNAALTVGQNLSERVGANRTLMVGGQGAGLLKMLMPLVQAGGKFLKMGGDKISAGGGVPGFAGIVAGVSDLPNELAAIKSKSGFAGSAEHKEDAGAAQSRTASALGGLLSAIMPASGTYATTVEKFRKDTTGLASSEQVGIAKNVLVGGVYTESVGQKRITRIGESMDYEAKDSILGRTTTHTLMAKEKFVIGGPGGTIIIDSSGITIKAKHLKIKSPKVDFTSGAPDQVEALSTDKPFAQDCKGK